MKASISRKKRAAYVIGAVLAVMGVLVLSYRNPRVPFTYFEPAYLPPGVAIKEKRISISLGFIAAEQNFRTEDWVYEISENKASVFDGSASADQNFNADSRMPTCSLLTSPAGQRYRLCHWVDYGRISVYEVKFIKAGTFLDTRMPTTLQQKFSVTEMSRYVDSFKPRSTWGMPVLRSNGP